VAEQTPTKADLRDIGLRIKALRKERKLSQEKLAAAADLSRTYLTVLEAGGKVASLTTLLRLAKALAVNPAELFLDPAEVPASTRAIVVRICSRLMGAKRSASELARLEQLIITFLKG